MFKELKIIKKSTCDSLSDLRFPDVAPAAASNPTSSRSEDLNLGSMKEMQQNYYQIQSMINKYYKNYLLIGRMKIKATKLNIT